MAWEILTGVVAGLLLMWLALVAALYAAGRRKADTESLREVLRLVPDVIRLLRRLAADPGLSHRVRIRLVLLVLYLLLPIDIVPDFLPVIGYADDAIVVALAIRSVVRTSGSEALDRHWPGTPDGLRAVKRLAGVSG